MRDTRQPIERTKTRSIGADTADIRCQWSVASTSSFTLYLHVETTGIGLADILLLGGGYHLLGADGMVTAALCRMFRARLGELSLVEPL